MKKLVALFAVFAVVFLFGGIVAAQDYFIPGVPEDALMVMDGEAGDWSWFPEVYAITLADVKDNDNPGTEPTAEDWDITEYMAWQAPNWLYMYCSITDDIFSVTSTNNGAMWKNDCHEFVFDGDQSGGTLRPAGESHGEQAQQYGTWIIDEPTTPAGGADGYSTNVMWCEDTLQWAVFEPYMVVGLKPPVGTTDVTYAYEIKVATWDALLPTEAESTPHAFSDGSQFNFTWMWDDTDATPETRDNNLGPIGGGDAWANADVCAVFECVAAPIVAVEATSWGSLKAQFE